MNDTKPRRRPLTRKVLRGLAELNESLGEIEKPTSRNLIKRWREIEHARNWITDRTQQAGIKAAPINEPARAKESGPSLFEGKEAQDEAGNAE